MPAEIPLVILFWISPQRARGSPVKASHLAIIVASSLSWLTEEGGVRDEQPSTGLEESQVGGWLFRPADL